MKDGIKSKPTCAISVITLAGKSGFLPPSREATGPDRTPTGRLSHIFRLAHPQSRRIESHLSSGPPTKAIESHLSSVTSTTAIDSQLSPAASEAPLPRGLATQTTRPDRVWWVCAKTILHPISSNKTILPGYNPKSYDLIGFFQ
jgi:hypothetical protein